jgi:hypothetical protein
MEPSNHYTIERAAAERAAPERAAPERPAGSLAGGE